MTWRKLFLFLLTLSLLVLAVAWVSSLRYRTDLNIPAWSLRLSLAQGSAEVTSTELRGYGTSMVPVDPVVSIRHTPIPPAPGPALHPMGEWKAAQTGLVWDRAWLMGNVGPEGPPVWFHKTLTFPLWAPWLLFIGVCFAFCHFMEKRSRSGIEKEQAEEDDSARSTGKSS